MRERVIMNIKNIILKNNDNSSDDAAVTKVATNILDLSLACGEAISKDQSSKTINQLISNLSNADTYMRKLISGSAWGYTLGTMCLPEEIAINLFDILLSNLYKYNSDELRSIKNMMAEMYALGLTTSPFKS